MELPQANLAERDPFECGQLAGDLVVATIQLLGAGAEVTPVAFEREAPGSLFKTIELADDAAVQEWFATTHGWDPGVVFMDQPGKILMLVPSQRGTSTPWAPVVKGELVYLDEQGRYQRPRLRFSADPGNEWFAREFAAGVQKAIDRFEAEGAN